MGSTSFVEAIKNKYIDQEELDDRLKIPKDTFITTEITLVGLGKVLRKQRNIENLTNIDVSNCNISSLGNVEELNSSLKNLHILNISGNLFTDILQIVKLIIHMPALKELIISGNPIKWKSGDSSEITNYLRQTKKVLSPINHLTIGSIVIENWVQTLEILSSPWSTIESLDLWNSNLNVNFVTPPQTAPGLQFISSLKSITLSKNSIQSLTQLQNLGQLTSLEELDISYCCLDEIIVDSKLRLMLKNLRRLNVAFNNLKSWRSIAELNKLPNLHYLLCQGNPVINPGKITKMMVIGRIGNLTYFNREEISPPQRKDSELFYMRKLFDEYLSYKEDNNKEFLLNNPRYEQLLSLYGVPEDLEIVAKKKNYYQIYIQLESSKKIITKKLPSNMPISNLKMLSKRLFGLSPCSDIKLVWYPKGQDMSCHLDKDGQSLNFYSIKDDDTIVIEQTN